MVGGPETARVNPVVADVKQKPENPSPLAGATIAPEARLFQASAEHKLTRPEQIVVDPDGVPVQIGTTRDGCTQYQMRIPFGGEVPRWLTTNAEGRSEELKQTGATNLGGGTLANSTAGIRYHTDYSTNPPQWVYTFNVRQGDTLSVSTAAGRTDLTPKPVAPGDARILAVQPGSETESQLPRLGKLGARGVTTDGTPSLNERVTSEQGPDPLTDGDKARLKGFLQVSSKDVPAGLAEATTKANSAWSQQRPVVPGPGAPPVPAPTGKQDPGESEGKTGSGAGTVPEVPPAPQTAKPKPKEEAEAAAAPPVKPAAPGVSSTAQGPTGSPEPGPVPVPETVHALPDARYREGVLQLKQLGFTSTSKDGLVFTGHPYGDGSLRDVSFHFNPKTAQWLEVVHTSDGRNEYRRPEQGDTKSDPPSYADSARRHLSAVNKAQNADGVPKPTASLYGDGDRPTITTGAEENLSKEARHAFPEACYERGRDQLKGLGYRISADGLTFSPPPAQDGKPTFRFVPGSVYWVEVTGGPGSGSKEVDLHSEKLTGSDSSAVLRRHLADVNLAREIREIPPVSINEAGVEAGNWVPSQVLPAGTLVEQYRQLEGRRILEAQGYKTGDNGQTFTREISSGPPVNKSETVTAWRFHEGKWEKAVQDLRTGAYDFKDPNFDSPDLRQRVPGQELAASLDDLNKETTSPALLSPQLRRGVTQSPQPKPADPAVDQRRYDGGKALLEKSGYTTIDGTSFFKPDAVEGDVFLYFRSPDGSGSWVIGSYTQSESPPVLTQIRPEIGVPGAWKADASVIKGLSEVNGFPAEGEMQSIPAKKGSDAKKETRTEVKSQT